VEGTIIHGCSTAEARVVLFKPVQLSFYKVERAPEEQESSLPLG